MTTLQHSRVASGPRAAVARRAAEAPGAEGGSPDAKPARAARANQTERVVRTERAVTTEQLLVQYRRRPSPKLREIILERHRGDVEAMAHALAVRLPRSVDVDDLVHAGIWGLMQAIDKFRADRGVPFRPFMRPRVRGAMLDELRSLDFLPRLWRRRARALERAVAELRGTLGREPGDLELAARLGTSEVWLRRARTRVHDGTAQPFAGQPRPAGADPFDELVDQHFESPLDALDRQELIAQIEAVLQPVEWKVLRLHYLEGLSGQEVAARLRLSAARICQIHGKVLLRLKQRFAMRAI
ncbi:MAG: sigma-70 family RNA polymerase sigma factor [Planctomycetes bacterium]|nr:sigma-70 family RNA polymerase sigma factor [Planctomycetota bacterium]